MERLRNRKSAGIGSETLRTWGLVFLAAGLLGRGVIQTQILGFGNLSTAQMMEQMSASSQVMTLVSASLILQAVETCALPIFALLLTEGISTSRNRVNYLGRVLGLALVCELPYNLALDGSLFAFSSRNPVFGVLLSLIMLCFFCRYEAPGLRNAALKAVITVAAVVWCQMLSIDHGAALVVVTAVLWAMRNQGMYRSFVAVAVCVVCSLFSPFYLAAPMGCLAVHQYNGSREQPDSRKHYLAYPAMLVASLVLGAAAGLLL